MEDVTSQVFLKIGNAYTKTKYGQKLSTKMRRFKSFFGITPTVCLIVWKNIQRDAPIGFHPKHLLWGLHFLKQYTDEHNRHSIYNADEKTIRYWTWIAVKLLSDMHVVIWENRFDGRVDGQTSFCSLDGVDFKIKEPKPFSPRWYSHKFKGPGLRYEIGLNIRTGDIVWKNGGYPCGAYLDLTIARQAYIFAVDNGEKTIADKGYRDNNFFILPNDKNKSIHCRIMSRHETVNKRVKQFQSLKQPFRHDIQKHPMVFNAVVNLTQLMLRNGEPLFNI